MSYKYAGMRIIRAAHLSVIAALSPQVLLFHGKRPSTVKLVDNRAPLESSEFLHALTVESRQPRRVSFFLGK